jgi:hypothetical protein
MKKAEEFSIGYRCGLAVDCMDGLIKCGASFDSALKQASDKFHIDPNFVSDQYREEEREDQEPSAYQQRLIDESDERAAFNDRLDMYRNEY